MRPKASSVVFALTVFTAGHLWSSENWENWPQFRGEHGAGASKIEAPTVWNVEKGQNVRWQTSIAGLAHASPILWKDRIYVAAVVRPGAKSELKVGLYGDVGSYSEKEAHQWRLICLNKESGKVLWDKLAYEGIPRIQRHTKATHCNATPATDGKRIAAILGSEGLFCFDMEGQLLWRKDLGTLHAGWYNMTNTQWGFASSPIVHDGKIIVQCDTLSDKYVAVFNFEDGHEIWRTPRSEASSFSTPLLAESSVRSQIVLNGWKQTGGYDFTTGRELWTLREGGDIPVPMPVQADNLVILTSAHGKYRPMRAVRLDATGDITTAELGQTNRFVAWCHPRRGNYMQTPIVAGDLLWGCADNGVLTCFDVKSGAVIYEERLGSGREGFTASPVLAGKHLYFTGEEGTVFVIPATRTFNVTAKNSLNAITMATPAACDGIIYFRASDRIIAIGPTKIPI
jgi:outer membrane protein assembly factor BamB